MNFKSIVCLICLIGSPILVADEAPKPQPDPRLILEGARLSATLAKLDKGLTGELRNGRQKTPVTLFLKGENIQFQFSEDGKSWRAFHVRIADEDFDLFEFVNGKSVAFPRKKLVTPIAGSDLTYEDLAMRFFYWPEPKLEGVENVGGQQCYKIRVNKPDGAAGRYAVVYVWVHTKYGAFMRIRGHNNDGALVKEFQVEDIMKVSDDVWTLEKMQVSTHDPKTGRRISITDMAFDKPKKNQPQGLR